MSDQPAESNPSISLSPVRSPEDWMELIDQSLSHVWMVRTFLKHCDESSEDEELAEVHRALYDYMLALGPSLEARDAQKYLRIAQKKFGKLTKAVAWFVEFQPEISGHMNFQMAAKSLLLSLENLKQMLDSAQSNLENRPDQATDVDFEV